MNKKLLFGSLAVGGSLAASVLLFARTTSDKHAPGSTSYDSIDDYIEEQMHRLHVPGISLAIIEGDKIVHQRGFGKARPGGEAPTPQTPLFIGSLTKSITALAVMQLVEASKVELDAPVQRYLPWFRVADPDASAQMTVRHLLNQTSGLILYGFAVGPGRAGRSSGRHRTPGARLVNPQALCSSWLKVAVLQSELQHTRADRGSCQW